MLRWKPTDAKKNWLCRHRTPARPLVRTGREGLSRFCGESKKCSLRFFFFFFAKRKPVHLEAANVLFPVKILSFVCLMTYNFELDKYMFLRLCFSLVTFFKTFTHDCFIPGPIEENTKVGTIFLSGLSYLLGSLCNDDGDGNKNVKRVIGLLRKITLHTCIPILSFFLHFLSSLHHVDVKCLIARFMEDVNKRQQSFLSFS